MASDKSVCDEITARLTPMGPVAGRNMFGGYGIFMDGLMFGLIAGNELYFKVDDQNRAAFEAAGSAPFTYHGKSKPVEMSYRKVPAAVFNDMNALVEWGTAAFSAANRAKRKK